ncbi:hypothetical protein QQ054_28295 [Oscillatoria amoena NRMC-F 0135]|nr:hypothetical protein [Oscillatoria amoena NRMC-F 0135]
MGKSLYVFLKLVNLVLCVLLITTWILFSHLGFNAFSESDNMYEPEVAFLYQIGLVTLLFTIAPLVLSIMLKETHNKLFFFVLTLFNIFLIFIIVVLFTIADTY